MGFLGFRDGLGGRLRRGNVLRREWLHRILNLYRGGNGRLLDDSQVPFLIIFYLFVIRFVRHFIIFRVKNSIVNPSILVF